MDKSYFKPEEWQKLSEEVREILVNRATFNNQFPTGKLCRKISSRSMKPTFKALEKVLGEISESEDRGERGMLNVFVVNKRENYMPGDGFFEQARKLGRKINMHSCDDKKKRFVKEEGKKVHQIHRDPTILKF